MQIRSGHKPNIEQDIKDILASQNPEDVRDSANQYIGILLSDISRKTLSLAQDLRQTDGEKLNFLEYCFKHYSKNRSKLLATLIDRFGSAVLEHANADGCNLGETIAATGDEKLLREYLQHIRNNKSSYTQARILKGHGKQFMQAIAMHNAACKTRELYDDLVADVVFNKIKKVNLLTIYPKELGDSGLRRVMSKVDALEKDKKLGTQLLKEARNARFRLDSRQNDTVKGLDANLAHLIAAEKYASQIDKVMHASTIAITVLRLLQHEDPNKLCDILEKHHLSPNKYIDMYQVTLNCPAETVEKLIQRGINGHSIISVERLAKMDPDQIAKLMLIVDSSDTQLRARNLFYGSSILEAKNAIYYYIKSLPLDERIKRCEQALDPETFLGAMLYTKRGKKECDTSKGTLWWVNKMYQSSLKEKAKLTTNNPSEKGKEEALPHSSPKHRKSIELDDDNIPFEDAAKIIENYFDLLLNVGIETPNQQIQSISEIIDDLASKPSGSSETKSYIISKMDLSNEQSEKFYRLLTDITMTNRKNADRVADLILLGGENIAFNSLLNTASWRTPAYLDCLQALAETATSNNVIEILGGKIASRHYGSPDNILIAMAHMGSNDDVTKIINILKIIANQSPAHARQLFTTLKHSVITAEGYGSQWNFGATIARHQDGASFLHFIQLLECLSKQGISKAEIDELAIINYRRFGDRNRSKDTKADIVKAIEAIPSISERIAICDKALDPTHPLGRVMFMQRGKKECDINRGQLRQVAKIRAAAIAIRERANQTIPLNNNDGLTPLHLACSHNNVQAARLLLEAGAEVDAVDIHSGQTAIMYAATLGHTEILQLLLNSGADADKATFTHNTTALAFAVKNNHIKSAAILLKHGANATIPFIHTTDDINEHIDSAFKHDPDAKARMQDYVEYAHEDKNKEVFITPAELAEIINNQTMLDLINKHVKQQYPELFSEKSTVEVMQPITKTVQPTHEQMIEIPDTVSEKEVTIEDIDNHSYLKLSERDSALDQLPDYPLSTQTEEASEALDHKHGRKEENMQTNSSEELLIPGLGDSAQEYSEASTTGLTTMYSLFSTPVSNITEGEATQELKQDLLLSFEPIRDTEQQTDTQEDLMGDEIKDDTELETGSNAPHEDLISFDAEVSQNTEAANSKEEQLALLDQLHAPKGKISDTGLYSPKQQEKDSTNQNKNKEKRKATIGC